MEYNSPDTNNNMNNNEYYNYDTQKNLQAEAEKGNNLSYFPTDNGTYNCFMSSNPSFDSKMLAIKKWTLLMLLFFSLLSVGIGFVLSMLSFGRLYHDQPEGNNHQITSPDNVNVNVAPNRPKIETSTVPGDNKSPMTVAQVCASVMSANVEITTETAVYNNLYGHYVTEGAGSGVIISKDGYIITNHHVIENARSITVTLSNGNAYKATLVGSDSDTDIAVLSISATESLTSAILGDSTKVVQGDEVVIIGNPLGTLGSSVTNGIISALDRQITIDGKDMMLMQTNAAVNPGNSGGGMYNMYGELIGIINAKSSGDGIEGIGFAIPINFAFNISSQIIQYGYVRGRIDHGLTVISVDDVWDMTRYNVSKIGVYIYKSEFSQDLRSGDRIVEINGTEISAYTDIKKALQNCSAGDTVKITVERRGGTYTYDLTLQEYVPQNNNFN